MYKKSPSRLFSTLLAGLLVVFSSASAYAAFGVSTSGTNHIVDTGAGLVFTVSGAGDLTSIKYNGRELLDTSKPSGIGSGTGATSVTATTSGSTIKLTCYAGTLTQYYVVNKGLNNIYMATYTTAEPSVGELRFIGRFNQAVLPNVNPNSNLSGTTGPIEGQDIFGLPDGQTRSKFYSAKRFIDDHVHGMSGTGVGAYMVISGSGYEASSGGPFYKDIDEQNAELYFYMNSGHSQIENWRQGLHGPYAVCVTSGAAPSASLDMSFMGGLGIKGWVSSRGHVTGTYSGIPSGYQVALGWSNATAQYWTYASGGTFTSPAMIPGTYTMTLYKGELAVASTSVSVGTGTTSKNIASAELNPATIWQIGEFDGTPSGFLNADKQTYMHPSDVRMAKWVPTTFTIGSSVASFPMAQFQAVNDPTKIVFTLSSAEVKTHILRVGTTVEFGNPTTGGRPQVVINAGTSHAYAVPVPAAPTIPYGRSITRGVYHGYYNLYSFSIPASAFVAGTNTIEISAAGTGPYGGFLSASFVYDAVALDQ